MRECFKDVLDFKNRALVYFFYSVFLFVFLVFIDQISKYLIRSQGGFYICNEGIAFGISLFPVLFWLLWLSVILVLIVKIFGYKVNVFRGLCIQKNYFFDFLCFLLILSGAVSNIIDRARFGCVVDFIDLKIWPVFNMADVFIVAGCVFLLAKYWKSGIMK